MYCIRQIFRGESTVFQKINSMLIMFMPKIFCHSCVGRNIFTAEQILLVLKRDNHGELYSGIRAGKLYSWPPYLLSCMDIICDSICKNPEQSCKPNYTV